MMPLVVLGEATTNIDTALVSELINLVKTTMGLFSQFPLNVYLIGGLTFLGFGIFRSAKHAVR